MEAGQLNFIAIFVAAIVAFLIGGIYYTVLGKIWMQAAGITPDGQGPKMVGLFATSFIGELVMAFVTAGIIWHVGSGQVNLQNGVISGILLWIGLIAPTMMINHRYEQFGWKLILIDAGHWLLVMIGIGAVIGLFGI